MLVGSNGSEGSGGNALVVTAAEAVAVARSCQSTGAGIGPGVPLRPLQPEL